MAVQSARVAYTGQSFDPTGGNGPPPLPLIESSDFEYMAHPERYDVHLDSKGVGHVLPVLRKINHRGGSNGIVTFLGDAKIPGRTGNAMSYVATEASKGFVHIPQSVECVAFGETRKGYSHGFQNQGGDWHFTEVWRRPYLLGQSVRWEQDRDGYLDFLRKVQAEYLPPVDSEVLRALEISIREHLVDAERRKAEPAIATLKAKLAAFDKPKRKAGSAS